MIALIDNGLEFSFLDVHSDARLTVKFQRTLRIPDNGKTFALPPGLGEFPLREVDDFAKSVPPPWLTHGGVMLPMYQSEALWILLESHWIPGRAARYPFAVKVAAGKIDAVTGKEWTNDLHSDPQDYLISPTQPWLDGFALGKGVIRQFVAKPLGSGYSAEEQLTRKDDQDGLQLLVRPMKAAEFEERFPIRTRDLVLENRMYEPETAMPGIYRDTFGIDAWEHDARSRCFVHILNSLVWKAVTRTTPPAPPITSAQYYAHRLPWFDYYAEGESAIDVRPTVKKLRRIIEIARQRGDAPPPDSHPALSRRASSC